MQKKSPEVKELRKRIEKSVNKQMKVPADFEFLSGVIWERIHENISVSTLKRIWGYVSGSETIRENTLNQLSRIIYFDSWEHFKRYLIEQNEEESDFCCNEMIRSSELAVGDCIEVGWQPNRKCLFKYIGNDRFEVVEAENSKLCVGDKFSCSVFFKNEAMRVDQLIRSQNLATSYVAGFKNGLTLLRKIE